MRLWYFSQFRLLTNQKLISEELKEENEKLKLEILQLQKSTNDSPDMVSFAVIYSYFVERPQTSMGSYSVT